MVNTNSDIRLTHVSIKGLFNQFDYELEFDDLNTIIIAPNGFGKTTIFHLINATLAADSVSISFIRTVPFKTVVCTLANGSVITLGRRGLKENEKSENIIKLYELGLNFVFRIETAYDVPHKRESKEVFAYECDYLKNMDHFHRELDIDTIGYIIEDLANKQKLMLIRTKCRFPLFFISTYRLFSRKSREESKRGLYSSTYLHKYTENENLDYLELADSDIARKIDTIKREYERKKTEAQSRLPISYIQSSGNNSQTYEEFIEHWKNYIEKIDSYTNLGFIEEDVSSLREITEEDYSEKASFLNVYLQTYEKTIEPLNTYYSQFKLFKEIFDTRNKLTGKTIQFTDTGVKILTGGNQIPIKLRSLSSGEKNDFILFYNLMFRVKERGIMLIDEPEISLHIEWQETFLDYLIEITKEKKVQTIVATHSPHIINGHFDLIKEL